MSNLVSGESLSTDAPCGVDLEDTQLLASFDAFRIFGSDLPLPAAVDWLKVQEHALAALTQSHDLRLLAHLAAATLRTQGIGEFCAVVTVADRWLAEHWDLVFPRVAEDALLRRNALSCFADRMAIVDPLRRAPIISHRRLGAVTLRDVEFAMGELEASETDRDLPGLTQIEAALAESPAEERRALLDRVSRAGDCLERIAAGMQQQAGLQSVPDFGPLSRSLERIRRMLSESLGAHTAADSATLSAGTGAELVARANGIDSSVISDSHRIIQSRQEAIRAIDAVVLFFRTHEPSSPVPLLLERAKRLVSKDFMAVLAEIAPEGLPQALLVAGVRASTAE
jgi:type VI secretion system protein ImpA